MKKFSLPAIVLAFGIAGWLVTPTGDRPADEAADSKLASDTAPPPPPKAVIKDRVHDFGIIDPAEKVEHTFLIVNRGEGPLELRRGNTTCKCTMSDIPEVDIERNVGAAVKVSSKIDQEKGPFLHSAEILTNDPENPVLILTIQGTIRHYVAAHPSAIVLANMQPAQTRSVPITIYSQVWDDFSIAEAATALPDVQWKAKPADAETLASLDAVSGYTLEVTIGPRPQSGSFRGSLDMTLEPGDDSASVRKFSLGIKGSIPSPVAVFGPHIEPGRILKIGSLRLGKGAQDQFVVKVRADQPELAIRSIETNPEFLRVETVVGKDNPAHSGLYIFNVEVPSDAPGSNYMGSKRGEIRIETDHPELPIVTIGVDFAVTSS